MKLFVADFHGVLEKGNEYAVLATSNKALENLNFSERFTPDDINEYYGLKWYEYFEKKIPGKCECVYVELESQCIRIQEKCFRMQGYHPEIKGCIRKNEGVEELLEGIINKNHDLILISNTDPEAMNSFLTITGLINYFKPEHVFAVNTGVEEKTKKEALTDFLEKKKDEGVIYEDIIIFGDSPNDIGLKSVSGGKTYLYTHPGRKVRNCEADYKITDLKIILREV